MDWIDNYANDVAEAAAWHQRFYSRILSIERYYLSIINSWLYYVIRQLDPFGHVTTTSFAEDKNNQPVDAVVDFTQIHQYNVNDFATSVQGYIPSHTNQYNKPCWMGEMGGMFINSSEMFSEY